MASRCLCGLLIIHIRSTATYLFFLQPIQKKSQSVFKYANVQDFKIEELLQ